MMNEVSIVKAGQQDLANSLLYAEELNANFQVVHSDQTFTGDPNIETPDVQAVLDDLTAKLQALGWQQVVGPPPNPWYSLTFQRLSPGTPSAKTRTVQVGQQDNFNSFLYIDDSIGNPVARSQTFSVTELGAIWNPDVQAALDDLTAKLQALGWQQVVGILPAHYYSLTFQSVVYTSASVVKPMPADAVENVFYAEDQNGNYVAFSDQKFIGDPNLQETPDAQAALKNLIAKLQALQWQQIPIGTPNPWYSYQFKKVVPYTF